MGVSSLLLGVVSTSAPNFGASVRMVKKRNVQAVDADNEYDMGIGLGEYFMDHGEECNEGGSFTYWEQLTPCCEPGYEYKHGDISGWGQIEKKEGGHDLSCPECAQHCTANPFCGSYECSWDQSKCNLNYMTDIDALPFEGFFFCKKIPVPDPNQPDWFDQRNEFLKGNWTSMNKSGQSYVEFGPWAAGACGSVNGDGPQCIQDLCINHPGLLCQRYLDNPMDTMGIQEEERAETLDMGAIACGTFGNWGGCAFWEVRTLPSPAPTPTPAPAPAPAPLTRRRRRRRN